MSDTRCKIQCIPNHHLCGQVGLRQVKWAALPQILSQGFRKDKTVKFLTKNHSCCRRTLGQAAHAQSRVSVGAVSPGQELHRWEMSLRSWVDRSKNDQI